ncbi:hypothetical protein GCM10028791_36500 [Echinicola sediminis]
MNKVFNLLFLSSMALTSCESNNIAPNTPVCIIEKIESLKKNSSCDDPSIREYEFQGEIVYVVDPGSCGADMGSGVFDRNCNGIGGLGGIAGNTEVNGEDFSSAIFRRTIWQK